MTEEQISDIIEWDVVNWRQALPIWKAALVGMKGPLRCLELGGRRGGPSLWLALQGHHVVCSDIDGPTEEARALHRKYGVEALISYEAINALDIPYEHAFDVVIFKSIVGGIARDGQDDRKEAVMHQIHKALKPGGTLLFAENLAGSGLHRFLRRHFVKWGAAWNYLRYDELTGLLGPFEGSKYETIGFLGAFGRTENQRQLLGMADKALRHVTSNRNRYIVAGYARKAAE
jgi:SAM-dependent methyltransferase